MKAKYLRIGNLVEWYGKPYPIIQIKENNACIEDLSNDFDQLHWLPVLSPIPLTEEWLLKFGFTSNGWLYEKTAANGTKYLWYYNTFACFREDLNTLKVNPISYLTQAEYVHELQNVYFSLTGEELYEQS